MPNRNPLLTCVVAAVVSLTLLVPAARADDVFEKAGKAIDDGINKTKKEGKKAKKKLDKAGKETKEGAEDVADDVVDTAKDVGKDAKKATDEVGKKSTDTAGDVGRKTKKWADKSGRVVLKGQKELEKVFSKETLDAITAALQKRVDDAERSAMWQGAVAKMEEQRPIAEAQAKEFNSNMKSETAKYKATVDATMGLLQDITSDGEAKKKLERLLLLCAIGTFNDETEKLGQWFSKLITAKLAPSARTVGGLGAPQKGVAAAKAQNNGNYPAKSFSLTIGWNIVGVTGFLLAGGFEGRFGVVGDLSWEKDRYDVRAVYTLAEQVGAGLAATGVGFDLAVNVMLSVNPTPTSNASGLFLGLCGEGGAGVGVEFELEWGFANGKFVPVPSIAAGIGFQDPDPGGAVLFNYGYAVTLGRDGWDHGIPGVPSK